MYILQRHSADGYGEFTDVLGVSPDPAVLLYHGGKDGVVIEKQEGREYWVSPVMYDDHGHWWVTVQPVKVLSFST